MTEITLSDVFGVMTDVPKYTYVDRQALDERFDHYLRSQKHVVLHGASKQGKSCLRKKNVDSKTCVVVQCLPDMTTAENLWVKALEQLGYIESSRTTNTESIDAELDANGTASLGLGLFASVSTQASASVKSANETTTEVVPVRGTDHLSTLAEALKVQGKRLVIEDFHYLPEESRVGVAFGLKALYEGGAYAIVIGIWSEQNLITFYNGDLTGRIEEINLIWGDEDLNKVLSQGEGALNVEFAPGLRSQIIESSFNNVGLLQRLAEKVCIEAGIFKSQRERVIISDVTYLQKARSQIVSDIRQRYTRIADVFAEGMRSDSRLHLHGRVYNELIEAPDVQLIDGIPLSKLLERIQTAAPEGVIIRQSDLTQCLERIERLQASRGITPLLLSFSKNLRKLFLNDREFLFYRRYSGDDPDALKVDLDAP